MKDQISTDPQRTLNALFQVRANRSEAIKLGLTGALALGASLSPEKVKGEGSCEVLISDPSVLVVDFSSLDCQVGMVMDPKYDEYGKSDWLFRMLVDSSPLPDQAKGVFHFLNMVTEPIQTKGTDFREWAMKNKPLVESVEDLLARLQGHGKIVGKIMQNALRENNIDTVPELHPIQRLYERARIEFDELDNITLFAEMNEDWFIDALYEHPDSKIVNLSWQVGDVGIKIAHKERDENGNIHYNVPPKIEVLGAYRKDAALNNLTKLAKVCNAHKDKLFLVAAGNFGDQLGEAKGILEEQGLWPTNLLTIGESYPGNKEITPFLKFPFSAFGADMYVDSQHSVYNPNGEEDGSTVSTAIASAIAEKIRRHLIRSMKKATPEAIIAEMYKMCREVPHYSGEGTMLLLDPDARMTPQPPSRTSRRMIMNKVHALFAGDNIRDDELLAA